MGYVPPSQPLVLPKGTTVELIRQDLAPTLTHLYATYSMSGLLTRNETRDLFQRYSYDEFFSVTPLPADRMWADRHLEALGNGLVAWALGSLVVLAAILTT